MRFMVRDLEVRYGSSPVAALDGVSVSVPEGALYSVLGPNGSGKSTLMRALLGLAPVARGTIQIDDRSVGDWPRRDIARSVGAVTQSESIAFPLTVRELVGMGRYPHLGRFATEGDHDRAAVTRALSLCDLVELQARDVGTLSGGEFQRARIARALAQEPRALVLDEPTASLDIRHQMTIAELLRSWADEGMTVILITHSLDLAARFSDRILLLANGRVAAEGPPAEVLREKILSDVYGWPLAITHDARFGELHVTPQRRLRGPD